jgi:hypothetical protein
MSDGNTAIQVSPADLTEVRSLITKVAAVLDLVDQQKAQIAELADRVAAQAGSIGVYQTENQQLHDKVMLLETQLQGEHDAHVSTQGVRDAYKDAAESAMSELAQTKRDRDDIAFKHLEVSEELAQANSTLGKFRELLGIGTAGQGVQAGFNPVPVSPFVPQPSTTPPSGSASPETPQADSPPDYMTPTPSDATEPPAPAWKAWPTF